MPRLIRIFTWCAQVIWFDSHAAAYVSFRLVLRCRQDARAKFAKMRSDVLVKMELLDQKHGE